MVSSATPKDLEDHGSVIKWKSMEIFLRKEKSLYNISVKNKFKESSLSVPNSTIKRCLLKFKYRRSTSRCKPIVTLNKKEERQD